jgi:hypothetical protein
MPRTSCLYDRLINLAHICRIQSMLLFIYGNFYHLTTLPTTYFWTLCITGAVIWVLVENGTTYKRILRGICSSGMLLNATVTIANSGWMPMIGMKEVGKTRWRPAVNTDKLLVLADRTNWGGFSIGDFIIISSLLILVIVSLHERGKDHA